MKPQANSSLAGPESHLKPIHWRCSPLHLKLGSPVTNQMSRDRELKEQQLPWSLLFYPVGKSTEFCSVLYFLTSGGGEGDWRWEGGTKHTTTRVTLLSGFPPKYWDRRPPRTVPELGLVPECTHMAPKAVVSLGPWSEQLVGPDPAT